MPPSPICWSSSLRPEAERAARPLRREGSEHSPVPDPGGLMTLVLARSWAAGIFARVASRALVVAVAHKVRAPDQATRRDVASRPATGGAGGDVRSHLRVDGRVL